MPYKGGTPSGERKAGLMASTRLIILNGAHKGQEFELQDGSNFIGRAESNDFVLDDGAVSSRHCELVVTASSVRVRDLGSSNGTWIDNRRVLEGEAHHGQILMLGSLEMRLMMPPVEIAIPALPQHREPMPTALGDGRAACLNHPGFPAALKCAQCGRAYCEACVRELRLVGGQSRLFCPACSGACESLAGTVVSTRRKSFASRLLETIRISFKRNEPKQ